MTTEIDIGEDFGTMNINDDNIPVYKYNGVYYAVFNLKGRGQAFVSFIIEDNGHGIFYRINKSSTSPDDLADKIDYSKQLPENITTVTFGPEGDVILDTTKAIEMSSATPEAKRRSPTPVPQAFSPPVSDEANAPRKNLIYDDEFGYYKLEGEYTPRDASGNILGDSQAQKLELELKPELAFEEPPALAVSHPDYDDSDSDTEEDFFQQFLAVERPTNIKTVVGVNVQTIEVNVNQVRDLLVKSDNEFLNSSQGQFLVNMNKIAQARRQHDTIGKKILRMKGLPEWIVPTVIGGFAHISSEQRAFNDIKPEPFKLTQETGSCMLSLDPVVPPMYTGFSMDTDKHDEIPGSWLKTRKDFMVKVAFQKNPRDERSRVETVNLPGNLYESRINLSKDADERVREQQRSSMNSKKVSSSRSSMYVTILTVPKAVRGVEVAMVGSTSKIASINGLIFRTPGNSFKPISKAEFQDRVPVECSSAEKHLITLENVLNKAYPTVEHILQRSNLNSRNIHDYLRVLKLYMYERNDLTAADWKAIGRHIAKEIKKEAEVDWATPHSEKVLKLSRAAQALPNLITPVDNGKYELCLAEQQYLAEVDIDSIMLHDVAPGVPTPLTVNTLRFNSIVNDEVHGLLFWNDVTKQFYTVPEYNRQQHYQLITKLRRNLERSGDEISCENLKLSLTDLQRQLWESNKGMLEHLRLKLERSNVVSSATFAG
jgi:hypothetical protein